jgi:hypothetical protein
MDKVLTQLLKSVLDLSVNFNSRATASVSVYLLAGAINNAIPLFGTEEMASSLCAPPPH